MLFGTETLLRPDTPAGRVVIPFDGMPHLTFERPIISTSRSISAKDLLTLDTTAGKWKKSNLIAKDAVAWEIDTEYAVGDVVIPSTPNTHGYICTVAGTSHGATEPTWPTDGSTVTDDTVTWEDLGVIDALTGSFGIALADVADPTDNVTIPVIEAGCVKPSEVGGLPTTALPTGYLLDKLILG